MDGHMARINEVSRTHLFSQKRTSIVVLLDIDSWAMLSPLLSQKRTNIVLLRDIDSWAMVSFLLSQKRARLACCMIPVYAGQWCRYWFPRTYA